jgi:hypothetical protein
MYVEQALRARDRQPGWSDLDMRVREVGNQFEGERVYAQSARRRLASKLPNDLLRHLMDFRVRDLALVPHVLSGACGQTLVPYPYEALLRDVDVENLWEVIGEARRLLLDAGGAEPRGAWRGDDLLTDAARPTR